MQKLIIVLLNLILCIDCYANHEYEFTQIHSDDSYVSDNADNIIAPNGNFYVGDGAGNYLAPDGNYYIEDGAGGYIAPDGNHYDPSYDFE